MRPGEAVRLLGHELELETLPSWGGSATPSWVRRLDTGVVLRVMQVRTVEPIAFVAYVLRRGGDERTSGLLAEARGGTVETAIALCEQDARDRAEELVQLLSGTGDWLDLRDEDEVDEPEAGTIEAALREVCS